MRLGKTLDNDPPCGHCTMTTILNFLKTLLPSIESQQERDEAWLAEAVDIHDLERRMRSIDERGRGRFNGITFGLYAR